jgi:DNA-directed RNA polymerase specialized sigma24 family protein
MSEPVTIIEVLASLPEEERVILTLFYLKSMPSDQIAILLAVPEKSVTAVIVAGKARLKAHLGL